MIKTNIFEEKVKKEFNQIIPDLERQFNRSLKKVPKLVIGDLEELTKLYVKFAENFAHDDGRLKLEINHKINYEVIRQISEDNYAYVTAFYLPNPEPIIFVSDINNFDTMSIAKTPFQIAHELVHAFQNEEINYEIWKCDKVDELKSENKSEIISKAIVKLLSEGEAEYESMTCIENSLEKYDLATSIHLMVVESYLKESIDSDSTKSFFEKIDSSDSKMNISENYFDNQLNGRLLYDLATTYFSARKKEGLTTQEIRDTVPNSLFEIYKIARKSI